MLGVQALKGFGNKKMIKTELVKTQMSKLQGMVKILLLNEFDRINFNA